MPRITPTLWYDKDAEPAAQLYTSVFPRSRIVDVTRHGDAGPGEAATVLTVEFELDGQRFLALNGGPMFQLSEAISLTIHCADQDEVDHYWAALTADGGQESQCGWLKDRFGLSWQVVPDGMAEALGHPDPERANAAMQAMLAMHKLDLAAVRAAAGLS